MKNIFLIRWLKANNETTVVVVQSLEGHLCSFFPLEPRHYLNVLLDITKLTDRKFQLISFSEDPRFLFIGLVQFHTF